jgi:predicted DNA-binding transcriptional regulator AlpA
MSTESQAEYESKGEVRESQMKPRTAQLGARKNPDSPRVHGLRLAASSLLVVLETRQNLPGTQITSPLHEAELSDFSPTTTTNGTTVEVEKGREDQLLTIHEVAGLLQVPVSWVYARTRKRCVDRIPGFRLGKYWRFRVVDIYRWIQRQQIGTRADV